MRFPADRLPRDVWGVTFAEFIGPHVVDDRLYRFDGRHADNRIHFEADPADEALWTSADGRYAVHRVADEDWRPAHTVLLVRAGRGTVGFYAGGMVWIDPSERGRGLAAPLVLAGSVAASAVPYERALLGFTSAGVAAHRAAHRLAVAAALDAGLPVPDEVADEAAMAAVRP